MSPKYRHKTWIRPLGPERSAPELSGSNSHALNGSYRNNRAHSTERTIKAEPSETSVPVAPAPALNPPVAEALKKLANSESLLALLGQGANTSNAVSDVRIHSS